MPFRDILVLRLDALSNSLVNAPWSEVEGQGIPCEPSAIWKRPVRRAPNPHAYEAAIDPLALLLRKDVYLRLTLPDPGPDDPVNRLVRQATEKQSPAERRTVLARLKAFQARYLKALERELGE